jgi:Protein of unknown function (DUF3617)
MKSCRYSNLFVPCAVVFLAGVSTLIAQLSDLPVKPGLWETHVNTKVGSSSLDGGAEQSCFSAGTTLGDYLTATNKGVAGTKCSVSNKVLTAHGISYDTACSGQSMASKGHIDFQLTDAGHFGGTSHTTVTGTSRGKPVNMAIDKTFTAKFLKSDCGDVKPLVVPSFPGR